MRLVRKRSNRVLPLEAHSDLYAGKAVEEAIDVARACGVHVEIVHFKCSGTDNWGKAAQALQMIADARARGLDVDCDAYPYAAGSNPLKNLLPQWVQSGGVPAMIERLKLAETRTRIRADIERDQWRLDRDMRYGNWRAVEADRRDLARDQWALDALLRDVRHDRRDIERDNRYGYGYRR